MARKADFNNYSPEYKKQIEKLIGSREMHQFRLAIGTPFKKPITSRDGTTSFQETVMYPASYKLPVRDVVIDPKTKEAVNIAVIDRFDDDDNPVFLQKNIFNDTDGFFSLNATDGDDRKWLEFLYASNHLADNENRNKNKEIICRVYDPAAEKRVLNMKRDAYADSLILLRRMDNRAIIDFAAGMGWDETQDIEILKNEIGVMVERNAGLFLDLVNEHGMAIEHKAVLKKAITAGLATYSNPDQTVYYKEQPVAKLDSPGKGQTYLDMWSKWVVTAPNGLKIFENIKKEAEGTNKVAKSA